MFSRKTILIFAGILLVTVNAIFLTIATRRPEAFGFGGRVIAFVAPFQELAARGVGSVREIWRHYFNLVAVSHDNRRLEQELALEREKEARRQELELENERLRSLLGFARTLPQKAVAAEIVGKDPSVWFKTVVINKGSSQGLTRGQPAVTAQGVVGQVVEVSAHQSKLMLLIDQNCAVDALIQRTRARGIVKGASREDCYLDYVMHEEDIQVGDTVVSSGFDGVFPKGLMIGTVNSVSFRGSDFFKEVRIAPAVDFDKLEEVLVILGGRDRPVTGPR
jgi:rod shape-determining protein MreC